MNGKLKTQYCPGDDMHEYFFLLLSHKIALKRVCWINLKEIMCKIAIRNAGMNKMTLQGYQTCLTV